MVPPVRKAAIGDVHPGRSFSDRSAVDGRAELQARIAGLMRGFGNLAEQISTFIRLQRKASADTARGPISIHFDAAMNSSENPKDGGTSVMRKEVWGLL